MELVNASVRGLIRLYKWIELIIIRTLPGYVKGRVMKMSRQSDILINGSRPWDCKVNSEEFFERVASKGPLGLGEGYMDGLWDCDDLGEFCTRVFKSDCFLVYYTRWQKFLNWLEFYFFNNQTRDKAFEVGEAHYDLGNDLYQTMLDPAMNYSCGYWKTAKNLEEAQQHKMAMIAKKLMLKPGMRVLDIGSGWGGLCKYLAENYGVSCVGVSVSKEQVKYCQELCTGLPTEFKLIDYRELPKSQKFDRIVSVGMFEHVGHNNYEEYFQTAHDLLKDDGIFLLHTMGISHHHVPCTEPWLSKYIFPNGILPYYKQMTDHMERKFILEDWHNMGFDYSKTIKCWEDNFDKGWPQLRSKYGDRFYRMWKYYLNFIMAMFKSRKVQLWQLVMSKDGIQGGYYAAR